MLVSTVQVSQSSPGEKPKHFKHKAMCVWTDLHGILEHCKEEPDLREGQQPESAPCDPGMAAPQRTSYAGLRSG